MPGYPYGGGKGRTSLEISRNPEYIHEPEHFKYEVIYKCDLSEIRSEGPYSDWSLIEHLSQIPSVYNQIRFYKRKGFKIKCIYEGDLFQITAEKSTK